MGNDAILLWLSEEMAWGYAVAVFVTMLGALQLAALQANRDDLRWLPPRLTVPLSLLLIAGALVWFYAAHYALIFVPGPAGLELLVLFGAGTATAVWVTRVLSRILNGQR